MFEYSIQLSPSEKSILSEILDNAQTASNFEKKNEEDMALSFYKKSIQILETNIKILSHEKQTIFQTLLESYKERINIIHSFQRKKSFTSVDDTFLYTHKLLSSSNLNNNDKKERKSNKKNISKPLEELNIHLNLKLNETEKTQTIGDALNIFNELDRLELILNIIEKTMLSGGALTKNLYVPAFIWKIEINDLVIEEIEKLKIKYLKTISDEIAIFLYDDSNLSKIKKESGFLRNTLTNLYKEEKFQNILNVSKTKKTLFENYKDIIKKNFTKLNLYITSASNNNNYVDFALNTIQSVQKLVKVFKTIEKTNEKDEEFMKNMQFFYWFFKDILVKIIITDLELRLNQYLVLIRKKIIENKK